MDVDPVDKAFVDSLVPNDCIAVGVCALVAWLDSDGKYHWRPYANFDAPVSQLVGSLHLMALHYALQPGVLPRQSEENDEDTGS